VDEGAILAHIDGLFARFAEERNEAEHFGEFLIRRHIIQPVGHGSEVNQR